VNTLSSSFASQDRNVQRNVVEDSAAVWLGDLEMTFDNELPDTPEEDEWLAERYSAESWDR